MKKEIEVWVGIHCEQEIEEGIATHLRKDILSVAYPEAWKKAKLIIELPEKSVSITESEFDRITAKMLAPWLDKEFVKDFKSEFFNAQK